MAEEPGRPARQLLGDPVEGDDPSLSIRHDDGIADAGQGRPQLFALLQRIQGRRLPAFLGGPGDKVIDLASRVDESELPELITQGRWDRIE